MFNHIPNNLVACICEGNAELEIIEMLLEQNLLKFQSSDLLDGQLFTRLMRKPKNLETRYLTQIYEPNQKIEIIRVIDSRTEKYQIKGAFKNILEGEVINCYTSPEIEMLFFLNEGKYENYQRSNKKPSSYCTEDLKFGKGIKQKGFMKNYFSEMADLLNALQLYHQKRPVKSEDTIYSLLK